MKIVYKKDDKTDINILSQEDKYLYITFQDIKEIKLSSGEIISKIIMESPLTDLFGYDEEGINELLYSILKGDNTLIPNFISKKEGPFKQMNYHFIERYMNAYNILKDLNEDTYMVIECNKNSFTNYLKYISNLDYKYTLYCRDLSLLDYYNILKDIDMNKYGDVIVDYQDYTSPVSIRELYDIANTASEIIEIATLNDLSPLEQIIIVYDRIKRREYKKNEESHSESRDIDKILKGDSIVCIGYANLFSAILSSLNIDNIVAINTTGKHARNLVHIKDDKYNIDIVLYFDVTGDSKKNNDNDYISKYNYFGMTLEEANHRMKEDLYTYFNTDFALITSSLLGSNTIKKDLNIEDYFELAIKGSYDSYVENICYEKEEEAKKIFDEVKSKYQEGLDTHIFAFALYNVRLVEYDMYIISDINLKSIKNSVLNKYLSNIIMKGIFEKIEKEEIEDLKLDLYIEMCLKVIPLLDRIDNSRKKEEAKGKLARDIELDMYKIMYPNNYSRKRLLKKEKKDEN